MHAVIGGTHMTSWAGLEPLRVEQFDTPYGSASAPIAIGRLAGREFAFLPRHGDPHRLAPHKINYRANLWALRELGVHTVLAIGTTGGIAPGLGAGSIVCPDQVVDYTWGREHTFSDASTDAPVVHVDFTHPFTEAVRAELLGAALECRVPLVDHGCYGCCNGPRLESAAEIRRLAQDGCDLVGQTLMPEAGLAREAGLAYAALCPVVNPAAGLGESRQGIVREKLKATREAATEQVRQIVLCFAQRLGGA
jgi:5'-methylthioinosine phosphorylase